jgi:nicotinate-nucleotide pyrophosphorylase
MKLKKHRSDVKDLRLMQDNHVQAIAARYQRLVKAFEQAIKNELQYSSLGYLKKNLNKEAKDVLNDAEGKE